MSRVKVEAKDESMRWAKITKLRRWWWWGGGVYNKPYRGKVANCITIGLSGT